MLESLEKLIEHVKNDSRKWSIARIECYASQIELDMERCAKFGEGWYKAKCDIISEEGFMPLEEAARHYLNH